MNNFYYFTGMYVILTLNLIVNIVTLISALLLITGSIKVSHELLDIHIMNIMMNVHSNGRDSEQFFHFLIFCSAIRNLSFHGSFRSFCASYLPDSQQFQKALNSSSIMKTFSKVLAQFSQSSFSSALNSTSTSVSIHYINC